MGSRKSRSTSVLRMLREKLQLYNRSKDPERIQLSTEVIASLGTELVFETVDSLNRLRESAYSLANQVVKQVLLLHPEVHDVGCSLGVIVPLLDKTRYRYGLYNIQTVLLADGRSLLAICRNSGSAEVTTVFLKLPECPSDEENTGLQDIFEEPGYSLLVEFLSLVVIDLPEVLKHIYISVSK